MGATRGIVISDFHKAQLPKCLVESAALNATNDEKRSSFLKILLGFSLTAALSGNVKRGAIRDVPIAFALGTAD